MRKNNSLAAVSMMLALTAFTGCKSSNNNQGSVQYMLPETKTLTLTTEQQQMVNSNNNFSLSLFDQTVAEERDGKSVFMSPLGVSFMLGMIQSGANAATQQQTATAIGFKGQSSLAINEWCHSIQTQAPELDRNVTFLDANAIYLNKQYDLQDTYKKDMKTYYEAGIDNLDFSSSKAAKTINNWCDKNTEGMIPTVLDKTDPSAVAYLLNAVYFEAKWTKQFDKADTKDETFTTESGEKLTLPMMHNKALVRTYDCDDYTAVWLPYGSGTAWNMIVFLPKEGKTIADVADKLKGQFSELLNHGEDMELDIKIPRFSLKARYDLTESLPKLGITNIFNSDGSGLTGICAAKDGAKEVYVSKMFQDAAIDVAEEGTKAAAVTVAEVRMTSIYHGATKSGVFHADHPFLYVITENNSDVIFFAGTYTGKS